MIDPFDYETFFKNPCDFKIGVTDALQEKPFFMERTL